MKDLETVLYERPTDHVARIVLNRPDARNAQNTQMLYDLNTAFDRAARDDAVKVIMLAGSGPHFSSGHDLREANGYDNMDDHETVGTWCGWHCAGAEAQMAREKEIYIGFSERWRNIPKPTIAEVQGKVIAGGLMLIWPCDIIIAAEGSMFLDNTVGMGVGGVEYFGHPWEVGARKAKEMLFTADWLSADDAKALGMVNHVVPAAELSAFSLAMAVKIAAKPMFALKLAKEAVNAAQDCSGRLNAMQTAFALHHVAHSHNMQVHGMLVDPTGLSPAVKGKTKN